MKKSIYFKEIGNMPIRAHLIKNHLIHSINKNHLKSRIYSYILLKLKNLIDFHKDEPNRN